jgi:hypothetical protein
MIIFSGWGLMTLPLFCLSVLGLNVVGSTITGLHLGRHTAYTTVIALLAGAIVFAVGTHFNRTPGIVEELGESGRVQRRYTRHTLYYVPMQYWGIIIPILMGTLSLADYLNII